MVCGDAAVVSAHSSDFDDSTFDVWVAAGSSDDVTTTESATWESVLTSVVHEVPVVECWVVWLCYVDDWSVPVCYSVLSWDCSYVGSWGVRGWFGGVGGHI